MFYKFFDRASFPSYNKHLVEAKCPSAVRLSNCYETQSNRLGIHTDYFSWGGGGGGGGGEKQSNRSGIDTEFFFPLRGEVVYVRMYVRIFSGVSRIVLKRGQNRDFRKKEGAKRTKRTNPHESYQSQGGAR